MAMPGISTEYLAEQLQETNRRLTEAIDALRDEAVALRSGVAELNTDLKTELARINTSLSWAKWIGGTVATINTASVLGVPSLAYQVGHRVAQIEGTIAGLQRTTEELRADFKVQDNRNADALAETRKASKEVEVGVEGQSADIARIQQSSVRLENRLAEMTKPSTKPH
jgi:hypothetical protein